MSTDDDVARMKGYNRDLIRKAAKAAGVVNVSYKSKAENIAAMIERNVVDVTESGEPVYNLDSLQDVIAEHQTLADDFVGPEVEAPIRERTAADLETELGRLTGLMFPTEEQRDRIAIISDELVGREDDHGIPPETAYPDLEGDVLDDVYGSDINYCPACGEPIDYCQGHGEIGDPEGFAILQAEREGDVLDDIDDIPIRVPVLDGITHRLSMDGEGNSVLTLVVDGNLHTVDSSDVVYARIVTALLAGEDPRPFLGTEDEIVARWAAETLSERVVLEKGEDGATRLLIDGEEVHGKVVEQFKRYWLEGRDPQNLLRFLERVASNPLTVAEHNLYAWDSALTIDPEGYFIGFKKVFPVHDDDGNLIGYRPSQRGPGAVNGIEPEEDEYLVMNVGDVVTIDRDLVRPGPECAVGLHVGTHAFAKSFSSYGSNSGSVVMEVRVDPADIVNVPQSTTGKLRCCEFLVLDIHGAKPGAKEGDTTHLEPEATWNEEEAAAAVEDVFETEETKGFFRRIFGRRKG